MLEVINTPDILKQGVLEKLGGSAGGHKNWKARYFVLSDHLYYYNDQAHFAKTPKEPLGRIALNAYFVSKTEDTTSFEFVVHAYPKSLECRAHSAAEMDEWIKVLMQSLEDLSRQDE